MGKAGLIVLALAGMALTHPILRRCAVDAGSRAVGELRTAVGPLSLKTLASALNEFRSNDRDGGKVADFWTWDPRLFLDPPPTGPRGWILRIDSWLHPPDPERVILALHGSE